MPDVVNETPREILAAMKALESAELRYQSAISAFRMRRGAERVTAAQFVCERRKERDDAHQMLDALQDGAR